MIEAKAQIAELKAQLVDAAEHKINALERARKIDELQSRLVEVENEKSRLIAQLSSFKARCRSTVDCSMEKNRRDEQIIQVNIVRKSFPNGMIEIIIIWNGFFFFISQNMRDDIARLRSQLTDANHKLSQLQTFRTSVARLLHLRDIPHSSLLHRLQTLCHAQNECTTLSLPRRYDSVSPIGGDHSCPRYDGESMPPPPSTHCRPLSSNSGNGRRFDEHTATLDDSHFDDDFDFLKKKHNF